MARKHTKNPVNIDRYGDLFYDLASQFDEIVLIGLAEVFEGDEAAADPDMMPVEKIHTAKLKIAAGIVRAYVRMQRGRRR